LKRLLHSGIETLSHSNDVETGLVDVLLDVKVRGFPVVNKCVKLKSIEESEHIQIYSNASENGVDPVQIVVPPHATTAHRAIQWLVSDLKC